MAADSADAELLRLADLLVIDEIDEITMLHKFNLRAIDRTLRDLRRRPDVPFGGMLVVACGDFRQRLPVVPRGTPRDR